jgi:hypothetical protein
MSSGDDDTTYRFVEPTRSSPRRRSAANTVREGEEPRPATEDDPASILDSEEGELELERSRHVLGADDIGKLIEDGEYQKVCDLLGPPERAESLEPTMRVLYLIARGELGEGAELADLPHLAMETCGELLDMPPRSRASRLLAKRLLGLSSAHIRGRMPAAQHRFGLVAAAVVVGLVVGWLIALFVSG